MSGPDVEHKYHEGFLWACCAEEHTGIFRIMTKAIVIGEGMKLCESLGLNVKIKTDRCKFWPMMYDGSYVRRWEAWMWQIGSVLYMGSDCCQDKALWMKFFSIHLQTEFKITGDWAVDLKNIFSYKNHKMNYPKPLQHHQLQTWNKIFIHRLDNWTIQRPNSLFEKVKACAGFELMSLKVIK